MSNEDVEARPRPRNVVKVVCETASSLSVKYRRYLPRIAPEAREPARGNEGRMEKRGGLE